MRSVRRNDRNVGTSNERRLPAAFPQRKDYLELNFDRVRRGLEPGRRGVREIRYAHRRATLAPRSIAFLRRHVRGLACGDCGRGKGVHGGKIWSLIETCLRNRQLTEAKIATIASSSNPTPPLDNLAPKPQRLSRCSRRVLLQMCFEGDCGPGLYDS